MRCPASRLAKVHRRSGGRKCLLGNKVADSSCRGPREICGVCRRLSPDLGQKLMRQDTSHNSVASKVEEVRRRSAGTAPWPDSQPGSLRERRRGLPHSMGKETMSLSSLFCG